MARKIRLTRKSDGKVFPKDFSPKDFEEQILNKRFNGDKKKFKESFDYEFVDDEPTPSSSSSAALESNVEQENPALTPSKSSSFAYEEDAQPAKIEKPTPSQVRQQYMSDIPLGRTIAKAFPYSTQEFMNTGRVSGMSGVKDIYSLPGRFFYPGDMGQTGEETNYGEGALGAAASFPAKVVKSPYTLASLPALMTGGGVGANMALGGALGYAEGGNLMSAALGAGLGGIGASLPYLDKAIMRIEDALRRKGLEKASKAQVDAITNIALRGPGSKPMSESETARMREAHLPEIEEAIENMNPKQLEALINKYDMQMYEMASAGDEVPLGGEATIGRTNRLTANQIGRFLSDEEKALIKKISNTTEEYNQNLAKYEEAKANGIDVIEEIQKQLDNAQKQGVNASNAIDAETASNVATKNNEESMLREMALGEADRARYAMKPVTQDIQRGEMAVADVEKMMDDISKQIAEIKENVSARYKKGNFEELLKQSPEIKESVKIRLNDGTEKEIVPSSFKWNGNQPKYVNDAIEKIGELERKLNELEGHLYGEDIASLANEGSFFGNKNAYDAYLSSEYLTDAADVAAGEAKGLAEAGNAKKAGNYFANGTAAKEWQTMLDVDKIRLNGKLNKMRQSLEETKSKLEGEKGELAAEGKSHRSMNYVRGADQYVESNAYNSPRVTTNQTTADFITDLRKNVDLATTKMVAERKGPEGNFRRNARGQLYSVNPDANGKRGLDVINNFIYSIEAKARAQAQGQLAKNPSVYNEDVVFTINKLQESNDYELIDAVLNSCKWLSNDFKQKLRHQALMEKAAKNLKQGYNVKAGNADNYSKLSFLERLPVLDKTIGLYNGFKRIANGEKSVLSPAVTKAYKDLKELNAYRELPWNYAAPAAEQPLYMATMKAPMVFGTKDQNKK